MISWKYRFIFIHIPKCAGTSIYESLKNHRVEYNGHELTPFQKKQVNSGKFHVFTCVRNPWSRVVSNYIYAKTKTSYWHSDNKSTQYGIHPNYSVVKDMTFDQYIKAIQAKTLPNNYQTKQQYDWIKPYRKRINRIMRLESLEEDFKIFCNQIGIQANLPRANTTNHDDYTKYYTDNRLIEQVADIYQDDIREFNYKYR